MLLELRAQLFTSPVQRVEFVLAEAELRARFFEVFREFGDVSGGLVAAAREAVDLREQTVACHADGLVRGFQLGDLHRRILADAGDELQPPAELVPLGAEFLQHLYPRPGCRSSAAFTRRRESVGQTRGIAAQIVAALFRDGGLGRHEGFLIQQKQPRCQRPSPRHKTAHPGRIPQPSVSKTGALSGISRRSGGVHAARSGLEAIPHLLC